MCTRCNEIFSKSSVTNRDSANVVELVRLYQPFLSKANRVRISETAGHEPIKLPKSTRTATVWPSSNSPQDHFPEALKQSSQQIVVINRTSNFRYQPWRHRWTLRIHTKTKQPWKTGAFTRGSTAWGRPETSQASPSPPNLNDESEPGPENDHGFDYESYSGCCSIEYSTES